MKKTDIYQTLEHRNNTGEIEVNGPFWCSKYDENNNLKTGVRQPWLGEGYYFWDTRVEDALWWGDTVYKKHGKGYVVCKSAYDAHSQYLLDIFGCLSDFDMFVKCALFIKQKNNWKKVSFPAVIDYLRKLQGFQYKAIRAMTGVKTINKTEVLFPDNTTVLGSVTKVQICFFDKSMFTEPFKVVDEYPFAQDMTI